MVLSTTDKTHVTDDDTYTLISTLTYNVDRTYNGETITCRALNIVVPNGTAAGRLPFDIQDTVSGTVSSVLTGLEMNEVVFGFTEL
jgi:hypothetical protein